MEGSIPFLGMFSETKKWCITLHNAYIIKGEVLAQASNFPISLQSAEMIIAKGFKTESTKNFALLNSHF